MNWGLIKYQLENPTHLYLAYFPPEIGISFWKLLVQRVSKISKYISDFHGLRMQLELGDITYLNEHLAAVFIFANGSSLKIWSHNSLCWTGGAGWILRTAKTTAPWKWQFSAPKIGIPLGDAWQLNLVSKWASYRRSCPIVEHMYQTYCGS